MNLDIGYVDLGPGAINQPPLVRIGDRSWRATVNTRAGSYPGGVVVVGAERFGFTFVYPLFMCGVGTITVTIQDEGGAMMKAIVDALELAA